MIKRIRSGTSVVAHDQWRSLDESVEVELPRFGGYPITDIRNVGGPYWQRCIGASFSM